MSKAGRPVARAVLKPGPRDDPAQLRFIADHMPAMTCAFDASLRCVFANRRYAEFFGFTTASVLGRHVREIVGEAAFDEIEPYFAEVLRGHRTSYKRIRTAPDGARQHLEVELIPDLGPDGKARGFISVTTDATVRRREEQLRTLALSAAGLIGDADSVSSAIRSVIRAICQSEGWDCGRYLQPEPGGETMRQVHEWGAEDAGVQGFLERARHIAHTRGVGLTGRAWESGRPIWTADASEDPQALLRGQYSEFQLRGSLSFPVKAGGAVIGVLTFNSRERREPDERAIAAMLVVGSQIGQYLQKKRAEEDLRRFRAAMDASGDLILLIDPVRMRYVDANATACRMLGYTREEILAKGPQDLVSAPREQLAAEYQRLIDDPLRPDGMRGRYRRKDGSFLAFESSRQVVPSSDGVLIAAISRDIRARVETERALRESEARFRAVVESANEGIVQYDREERITAVNGAAVRLLGLPREKLLGAEGFSSLLDCVLEDGRPMLPAERFTTETMRTGQPISGRIIGIRRADGTTTWLAANTALLYAAGEGEPYGSVMTLTDITRLKRDEEIARLEHRVARAFDVSPDARSALIAAMRAICLSENWDSCRYLEVAGEELRPYCDWAIDDPVIRRYIEHSRTMTYERGKGVVGTAWTRRAPEWVSDVTNDPRIRRAQLARETGTRSALAVPIVSQEEVAGVLMFQSRTTRPEDPRLLAAMELVGGQIGQLVRRARAEDAVRESEERFRSLCALSSDVFWEQDENFRFTAFRDASGSAPPEVLGKARWELGHTNLSEADWSAHRALLEAHQPFRDLEVCRLLPDGSEVWASVSGEPVFDAAGAFRGYRGVGRDITAKKRDDARIRHMASHDALTGLPNRTAFSELLNAARESARRHGRALAVMFVDLDRFKVINDTLGHEVGDEVLREASRRLRDTLRSSDVVARLGGDEFVVMIPELAEPSHASTAARKVLAALVAPMSISGRELVLTASIGIAIYPEDGLDEQALMKNADAAMYRAKDAGKNNFKFHGGESDRRALERLAMETSLRKALDRQEFLLHYQPRVSLASGAVTGVEALVRWRHPELGLVPPGDFITLAEETGAIRDIGRWVLAAACAQAARWRQDGLPEMQMAVNVSARQLASEDFVEHVAEALRVSGLPARCLEIEITETVLAQSVERASQILARISALGVRVALDDFGTGYSSLVQLKRLPIDTLKVDRAFVSDLPHDADDSAIARAIITMGQSLELLVVAEGVETAEQRAFLEAQGCSEVQGYLISRPLPAEECAAFLARTP